MFQLTIETDNAAFHGDGERSPDGLACLTELARILRDTADRLLNGEDIGSVRDVNGNKVGSFETV